MRIVSCAPSHAHRPRVAIGGAERVPATGVVKFGIIRGAVEASRIEIPQMQP